MKWLEITRKFGIRGKWFDGLKHNRIDTNAEHFLKSLAAPDFKSAGLGSRALIFWLLVVIGSQHFRQASWGETRALQRFQ